MRPRKRLPPARRMEGLMASNKTSEVVTINRLVAMSSDRVVSDRL